MTRSRVNEGLPRKRGARRAFENGKWEISWFIVIEEILVLRY